MQLNADGIVGPLTWNALYEAYRRIMQDLPSNGPGSNSFEYTVQPGDTLWLLSRRYNTTVDAIKKLNGLTGDTLYIGQVLKIPSSHN